MIDKNMMRIILILAICGFVGCASNRNVVSVRQTESDKPVVLRMRKDRTFIHSLLYPIAFEFKKNDNRDIYYFENSYFAKNKEICPGTAGCFLWEENSAVPLSIQITPSVSENRYRRWEMRKITLSGTI